MLRRQLPDKGSSDRRSIRRAASASVTLCLALIAGSAGAQTDRGTPRDPGVRAGTAGGGGPIAGLSDNERALFTEGQFRATELEATCETCSDITPGSPNGQPPLLNTITNSSGLGARFNGDQCTVCHNQPGLGGSGGFVVPNPQDANRDPRLARRPENPLFDLVPHRRGAQNVVPAFEQQYGPIREAHFVYNPDGTRDGGIHQLWTLVGRTDDPGNAGCHISQPDFATAIQQNNVQTRIPLQLFGLGLIESITDREILRRHTDSASVRARFGITGHPTHAVDGTINRFGWKAQNKSLLIFSGEAYNVELGITNELFTQTTEETPECNVNKPAPNDTTRTATNDLTNDGFNNPLHEFADVQQFSFWMRFLDGPTPAVLQGDQASQAARGRQVFADSGCAACHTPQMQTNTDMQIEALENKPVNLYSDLMVHHMGAALADNIIQGGADVDEFRTTPLWGVGQRLFLLHDGRTSDLLATIRAHSSPATPANSTARTPAYPASEANASVSSFFGRSASDQQALLVFLRSL